MHVFLSLFSAIDYATPPYYAFSSMLLPTAQSPCQLDIDAYVSFMFAVAAFLLVVVIICCRYAIVAYTVIIYATLFRLRYYVVLLLLLPPLLLMLNVFMLLRFFAYAIAIISFSPPHTPLHTLILMIADAAAAIADIVIFHILPCCCRLLFSPR